MKERSRFLGKLFNKTYRQTIKVNVDLIEYEDAGIYYVYSPALELVGYGNTHIDARNSWEVVLEEYFNYTMNKKTLVKDLTSFGWEARQKNKEFIPPTFTWLLQNNKELTEVYNNHNFKKISTPISLPVAEFA